MSHCYNFISCDEESYPSIHNVCSVNPIDTATNGFNVFINNDTSQVYTLVYNGENGCLCTGDLPPYEFSAFGCEGDGNETFSLGRCDSAEAALIVVEFAAGQVSIGDAMKLESAPCDCYKVVATTTKTGSLGVISQHYDSGTPEENCAECLDDIGFCDVSERTIAFGTKVKLPEERVPDRGFKACCYRNIVLASKTSSEYRENDFTSFYFKKQLANDTCVFILNRLSDSTQYFLTGTTYGQYWNFGDFQDQPELSVTRVDWKKVLLVLGEGLYIVEKQITIGGLAFTQLSDTYDLREFSIDIADHTVRVDCVQDGELKHIGVDFKGTGYSTTLRMMGYFGNRNPEYVQDNIVYRDYVSEQNTMTQENKYQFQTNLLPVCITDELYDFMIFGNEIYISDYNKANHSYKFTKFAVELESNKGAGYYVNNRSARVNLVFTDRVKDKRKIN